MWKFGHVDKIDKVLLLSLSNFKICIVCYTANLSEMGCMLRGQHSLIILYAGSEQVFRQIHLVLSKILGWSNGFLAKFCALKINILHTHLTRL